MADVSAPLQLIAVSVDGRTVEMEPGALVWDACERAGVFVPVYCAHKKMEPVAVCRMCLVEVAGMPKLQPACATRVSDGMVITTASERVSEFRRGNLELLLLNHPLDCPVCDRGGECDLQDFTQRFGPGRARNAITEKVHFNKAVQLSDKITLDQERCILCWRCVRYYDEITGEHEIVLQQRGVQTLVDTFEGRHLQSEFQGNLPEICPVGALTHTKYRFQARPWDLRRTASVCPTCSFGCNLYIDAREDRVVRFASNDNPDVDDSWLCDTGRYSFPELNRTDRVLNPEAVVGGSRQPVSHQEVIQRAAGVLLRIKDQYGPEAIAVMGHPQMTNEEAFLLQWLARDVIGTPHLDHQLEALEGLGPDLFTLGIAEIERCSLVLVLGEEAERAAPVLTLRLFKATHKLGRKVERVGSADEASRLLAQVTSSEMVGLVGHESRREELRSLRDQLGRAGSPAKILTIPRGMNARGCQDMGLVPSLRPGYQKVAQAGMTGTEILRAAVEGQIRGLVMVGEGSYLESDSALLTKLSGMECLLAISPFVGALSRAAGYLLPGRTIAEKAGTVTNAEGRVQRVRAAVQPRFAFPPDLRALSDLGADLGGDLGVQPLAGPVYRLIEGAVPAYRGVQGGLRAAWEEGRA